MEENATEKSYWSDFQGSGLKKQEQQRDVNCSKKHPCVTEGRGESVVQMN